MSRTLSAFADPWPKTTLYGDAIIAFTDGVQVRIQVRGAASMNDRERRARIWAAIDDWRAYAEAWNAQFFAEHAPPEESER